MKALYSFTDGGTLHTREVEVAVVGTIATVLHEDGTPRITGVAFSEVPANGCWSALPVDPAETAKSAAEAAEKAAAEAAEKAAAEAAEKGKKAPK